MKISFDFDCTLGEDTIKKLASFLILGNADIYIITSRCKDHGNQDLYGVAEKLNIPKNKIYLTEGAWKWRKIKELGIEIHFDDVPEECELIILNTSCIPMLLWDNLCKESIKHEQFAKGIF